MIYIKRYNLCYIRVPKNASSSVMQYLYHNVCDKENDLITHGILDYPNKVSFINLPKLEHSHVDVQFAIDELGVPKNARFIGIIRHPLEKQISLYIFRVKRGYYKELSVDHFRSLLVNGELEDYRYWQTQHQHTYLEYNGQQIGEWWSYDHVQDHLKLLMNELQLKEKFPLQKLNSTPGDKKKLIEVFYDDKSKLEAEKAFAKDIELYERINKKWNF